MEWSGGFDIFIEVTLGNFWKPVCFLSKNKEKLKEKSIKFNVYYLLGQPRRHLLTTGWSIFVSQKNLVSGDAVLFLRLKKKEINILMMHVTLHCNFLVCYELEPKVTVSSVNMVTSQKEKRIITPKSFAHLRVL